MSKPEREMIGVQYAGLVPLKLVRMDIDGTRFYDCKCVRCGTIVESVEESLIRTYKIRCCPNCNKNDLKGMRFTRLMVIEKSEKRGRKGNVYWRCKCDCGREHTTCHLTDGLSRSCGCLLREIVSEIHSIDLTGQVFGRLKVLRKSDKPRKPGSEYMWVCQCQNDGNVVEVFTSNLTSGNTSSCGCLQKERTSAARLKWGTDDEQRLSDIYNTMKQRCYNPNCTEYHRYGARGITVCDEWLNPEHGKQAFVNWSLCNGYALDLSIDRKNEGRYHKNQDGPYAPWNCRWATDEQQANNTRTNIRAVVCGVEHTIAEWAKLTGLDYDFLRHLYHRDFERTLRLIQERFPKTINTERASMQ